MTAARQADATLEAGLGRRLLPLHSVLVALAVRSKMLVGLGGCDGSSANAPKLPMPVLTLPGMALASTAARAATLTASAGSAEG